MGVLRRHCGELLIFFPNSICRGRSRAAPTVSRKMSQLQLRTQLKQTRLALSTTEREVAAQKITAKILALPEWQAADHIAIYLAVQGEVTTDELIKATWQANKKIYLPVVQGDGTLQFSLHQENDTLIKNRYGILEPQRKEFFPTEQLDLVITPLVGFDDQCNRLGMGSGYYDKTFAFLNVPNRPLKPQLIGLAYGIQRVEKLTPQSWDVPLNKIVTENTIIKNILYQP